MPDRCFSGYLLAFKRKPDIMEPLSGKLCLVCFIILCWPGL